MGQAVFKRIQFPCNYFGYKASREGCRFQDHSPPLLLQQQHITTVKKSEGIWSSGEHFDIRHVDAELELTFLGCNILLSLGLVPILVSSYLQFTIS